MLSDDYSVQVDYQTGCSLGMKKALCLTLLGLSGIKASPDSWQEQRNNSLQSNKHDRVLQEHWESVNHIEQPHQGKQRCSVLTADTAHSLIENPSLIRWKTKFDSCRWRGRGHSCMIARSLLTTSTMRAVSTVSSLISPFPSNIAIFCG